MVLGKVIGRILPKAVNPAVVKKVISGAVATNSNAAVKSFTSATKKAATNTLDYGRKVFALPEGQVTTRSGKVYTRTMGKNGERVYTDAEGNKTTFNGLFFKDPGYNESAIFRLSPDGAYYSLRFSTGNLRFNRGVQKVQRYVRDKVGGECQNTRIEINPKGRVVETQFDYHNAGGNLSGIRTRYGCPKAWNHDVFGWLNWRGVTDNPPLWTSLSK